MNKAWVLAVFLGAVAGCSSEGDSEFEYLRSAFNDAPVTPEATRAEALVEAGAPMLVIGLEKYQQSSAMVHLAQRDNYDTWINTSGDAITTREGVLIATRGLGFDLMTADVRQLQTLLARRASGQALRFHAYVGGEDSTIQRSYVCDVSSRGPRDVELSGRSYSTELMEEDCVGPDSSFINLYWLSGDQVIQSRQWVSPGTEALQIGVLRP